MVWGGWQALYEELCHKHVHTERTAFSDKDLMRPLPLTRRQLLKEVLSSQGQRPTCSPPVFLCHDVLVLCFGKAPRSLTE